MDSYYAVPSVFGSYKKEIRPQYRNGTAMRIYHSPSDITTAFNSRIRQAFSLNTQSVIEHSSEINGTSYQKKQKHRHCVFLFGVEPVPIGLTFVGLKNSYISRERTSLKSVYNRYLKDNRVI